MQSVTSLVQRRFYPRRPHTAAEPVSTAPVLIAPDHPETWTDGKQLAMLSIGQFLSEKIKDCAKHMRDNGVRVSQEDFLSIRNNGLAFKRSVTDRYHALTPSGIRYAHDTATVVARKLKLHHMTRSDDYYAVSSKCTCGWFKISRRGRGRNPEHFRALAEQAHVTDPDAWIVERAHVNARTQEIIGAAIAKHAGGGDG